MGQISYFVFSAVLTPPLRRPTPAGPVACVADKIYEPSVVSAVRSSAPSLCIEAEM